MDSDHFDTSESFSVRDHLYYPAAADGHSSEETLPLQPSEPPVQNDKLHVGNLSQEISMLGDPFSVMYVQLTFDDSVDLHKAFKKFGQISDIQLPYHTGPGGKPKGYAFVMFGNREVSTVLSRRPCLLLTSFVQQDAARAQVKMDGAILSKRIIKVDFAHQEKSNSFSKNRKPGKDAAQVTSLSMLKGSQHTRYFLPTSDFFFTHFGRSTQEQIALAEAKLRELSRSDPQQEGSSKSSRLHPSLPSKPPFGVAPPNSSRSSMTQKPKSTLPSLPLAAKPATPSSTPKTSTTSLPSASMASGSLSASARKVPKLTGIKIIKKAKDSNSKES